jgi:ribose-phosphate pyrophosphokinase
MNAAVFAFGDDHAAAERLAVALGAPRLQISLHAMPDGESLPVAPQPPATVILYRSLDRPDGKLLPLLLAADALRRSGARRLVLVAPYMPYLRQDAVFEAGQPLSRDVFGALLGPAFDRIVTVEPHLHRTADLTPVFSGTPVSSLSAAELLADAIGRRGDPVIVGPDAESEPWVRRIAERLQAPWLVAHKERRGDRAVEVTLPAAGPQVAGRRTVLVDDICSTGGTLIAAIQRLRAVGAASVEAAVVHGLFTRGTGAALRRAGARAVISTDSCGDRPTALPLAPLLARALSAEIET